MALARSSRQTLQPATIERPHDVPRSLLTPLPRVDATLLSVFRSFEGAQGMLVSDSPDGTIVYLIVSDRDAEDAAYEVYARARGLLGDMSVTFVAAPVDEAGQLSAPDAAARPYRFR